MFLHLGLLELQAAPAVHDVGGQVAGYQLEHAQFVLQEEHIFDVKASCVGTAIKSINDSSTDQGLRVVTHKMTCVALIPQANEAFTPQAK